jgi:hypothetical protein
MDWRDQEKPGTSRLLGLFTVKFPKEVERENPSTIME